MRTIDADELQEEYKKQHDGKRSLLIDVAPTVEPQRIRGRWVGTEFDGYADGNPVYYEWECSACGCLVEDEEPTWNYCPNCGAEMER